MCGIRTVFRPRTIGPYHRVSAHEAGVASRSLTPSSFPTPASIEIDKSDTVLRCGYPSRNFGDGGGLANERCYANTPGTCGCRPNHVRLTASCSGSKTRYRWASW